jgi:DNA-binding LytR/AlgR family response regulator
VLVDDTEVVYASAARGYTYLKLARERVLVAFSLAELADRQGDRAFRAHRSHLVNLDHVGALAPDFGASWCWSCATTTAAASSGCDPRASLTPLTGCMAVP